MYRPGHQERSWDSRASEREREQANERASKQARERTRERASYYVERRRRDSREGSSDPQGEEEYEEMKDANAVRRLSRPETDLERAVLEIVKKTISKRRDNKGAGTSDHAHPPPSLNGRRLSGENEPPRRASEDEEREREKCVKLKEEIQEMFIRENRTKREVHVTTSSKFRGCLLYTSPSPRDS